MRKKDNKARTFAPPDNTKEKADVRKKDNTSKEEMYFEIDNLINKVKNDFDVKNEISLGRKEYVYINDFIDFLNDIKSGKIEHIESKKDMKEEFKIVKKNVKNEFLKDIVKNLGFSIFGHDNDDNDDNKARTFAPSEKTGQTSSKDQSFFNK